MKAVNVNSAVAKSFEAWVEADGNASEKFDKACHSVVRSIGMNGKSGDVPHNVWRVTQESVGRRVDNVTDVTVSYAMTDATKSKWYRIRKALKAEFDVVLLDPPKSEKKESVKKREANEKRRAEQDKVIERVQKHADTNGIDVMVAGVELGQGQKDASVRNMYFNAAGLIAKRETARIKSNRSAIRKWLTEKSDNDIATLDAMFALIS